ncbi:MAG: hypothetical protein AAFY88_00545 [Acidobacteriota bacterium]
MVSIPRPPTSAALARGLAPRQRAHTAPPIRRGLVALLALLTPTLLWGEASFTLPSDGEVLRYQRQLGEIDHADRGPEVVVYADGRIVVRRPSYYSNPGHWQLQGTPGDVRGLIAGVVEGGLVDVTEGDLRERRRDAEMRRIEADVRAGRGQTFYAVGGADRSVLTLTLDGYRPASELGDAASPVSATWAWSDLYGDAERFRDIRELVAFHALERRLLDFLDHPDLKEVSP